jgi:hypothetical protein
LAADNKASIPSVVTTHSETVAWSTRGGQFSLSIDLPVNADLWDEFNPVLHELSASLTGLGATHRVRFGLRDIGVKNRMFTVNGRPTFLRGTLECSIFPLTGYPPTDVEAWKRLVRICQAHGLNHIRFHSWCPPEAAFVAADELGFYYHVECAAWTAVGDGGPVDQWLHEETEKIIQTYGNHPSMVLLAYGNEPSGKNRDGWLSDWVETWRARDPRRLYTTAAGWPALDVNDFQVIHAPRGAKGWGGSDYSREVASFEAPVVVHEMGQWCVFPNFDEIPKYTGSLKPRNFEIARDFLDRNGMLDQWRDFLRASGKLQALCYKEEIEAAFRTPGISGVQLLDLHDFPGQGTALVGVLDAFWGEKGYISPSQFRRFYDVTVPLARMEKRTWSREETFVANLELAHFGPDEFSRATLNWRVLDHQDQIVSRGKTIPRHITQGRVDGLGEIRLPLKKWKAPAAYRLVVGVEGTSYENDWTWWVYPEASPGSGGSQILVTRQLNEEALARLGAGGKVLLTGASLGPRHPRNSFPPIFWNRFMFASQRTQTLGLLCDPSHPALAGFPTSFHSDWQWEPLLSQSKAVVMDDLPRGLRPMVQVIDDWNTSRKLGLVFECRVGTGKLLVCTPDLSGDMSGRLVAGQFLHSLLDYMRSGEFATETEVQEEVLVGLLQYMPASALVRLGAKVVTVSSEDKENSHLGTHAIDGDPETFWHTRWQPGPDPMPHELVIDLGRTVSLSGITALQRQDMKNGWVKGFEVYVRTGSVTESWGEALVRGEMSLSEQLQTNSFPQTVEARFLKLRVMSEGNGNPFAALTELDVVLVP